MSTTMTDPIQQIPIPPEGGWYAAAILAAAGLLKGAWPWIKSRDAAQAKLTAEERKIQREEDRDLVATLKAELALLKEEVKQLRDDRVADKVMVASLTAKLDHAEAENERLRKDRDHYRSLAVDGQRVAERAGQITAAETLAEEISEADEASSIAGGGKK